MTDKWQELKETIVELRDNDGTCTQQEVCKFLANLIDVLEKQMQEPKWIPVSERLPKEKDGSVLVTMPDKKVTTARYSEFSDTWYVGDMMGVGGPDPLAWVLPTPYEPQERSDKE